MAAGARKVIICDTRGIASPHSMTGLLKEIKDNIFNVEFHPHNDNGMAINNIKTAVYHGIEGIGTAVFGSGERGTMIDPRTLVRRYHLPYDKTEFLKFERAYKELIESLNEPENIFKHTTIITGTQYRLWNRDERFDIKFGVTSDKYVLSKLLGLNVKNIPDEMLHFMKNRLYEEKRRMYNSNELTVKLKEYCGVEPN